VQKSNFEINFIDLFWLKSYDEYLNVTINEHRLGGVFMIPMGWSNFETVGIYKRIE